MTFFLNTYNLFLFFVALISAFALTWPIIGREDFLLTIDAAITLINRKAAVLLDVRSLQLFEKGYIPQAKHCPLEHLLVKGKSLIKNQSQPILIIAHTQNEAKKARKVLIEMGGLEVFIILDGLSAWQASGLPILQKGNKK